jgi:hypothetical protein
METDTRQRATTLLVGGAVGALTGLAAAYLILRRAEQQKTPVRLEAGEGLRLGLLVLTLLRQVAALGEG